MPMQHGESTDAFSAMLSAFGFRLSALAILRYTPARSAYAYAIA